MYFVLCFLVTLAIAANPCPYKFEVHANRDNVMPPGTQLNYYDTNYNVALSFGCGRLYNASWPAYITAKANDWIVQLTGIDWVNSGTPRGDGSYVRPEGLFFPFVYGHDFKYRVHHFFVDCVDTAHQRNQFIFNSGMLLVMFNTGVFPGGSLKGYPWQPNDILGLSEYNFLNEDHQDKWTNEANHWRRKVIIRSRQPSHNLYNLFHGAEQFVYEELLDEETGEIGFSTFGVSLSNSSLWTPGSLPPNTIVQSTRNTMTWPHVQAPIVPYPSLAPCTN
jgi:hypothetical protein